MGTELVSHKDQQANFTRKARSAVRHVANRNEEIKILGMVFSRCHTVELNWPADGSSAEPVAIELPGSSAATSAHSIDGKRVSRLEYDLMLRTAAELERLVGLTL
jgi:hypothetical protein